MRLKRDLGLLDNRPGFQTATIRSERFRRTIGATGLVSDFGDQREDSGSRLRNNSFTSQNRVLPEEKLPFLRENVHPAAIGDPLAGRRKPSGRYFSALFVVTIALET